MPLTTEDLKLTALRAAYAEGRLTPSELAEQLLPAVVAATPAIFTSPASEATVLARCAELEAQLPEARGPLWGIPFAVKDNIDVAGCPTTAACPAFARDPAANAACVGPLLAAGGIFLGKTNLDQFACGLVGTRTPYGVPANAFDDRFTPGGSSCGSAVAVAEGLCTFALGTDTAGSGRVPAGNNGIVGIKPSVGRFSTSGIVPACYLLDCPSIFALTVDDGAEIARLMENNDISDPTYRHPTAERLALRYMPGASFRFAVPGPEFLDPSFEGPGGAPVAAAMRSAWQEALGRLVALGGQPAMGFDFSPFAETAVLLYGAAFVAERYAGIRTFLEANPSVAAGSDGRNGVAPAAAAPSTGSKQVPPLADLLADSRMVKVVAAIIDRSREFSAPDVFSGLQQLSELRAQCREELAKTDLLVVPTAAYNYTLCEIEEEEEGPDVGSVSWSRNANLGRWTNFVNLQDMCGVSVFSGLLRPAGGSDSESGIGAAPSEEQQRRTAHLAATGNLNPVLPFGITLLAPAWTDEFVAGVAAGFERATGLAAGPRGHGVTPYRTPSAATQ